MAKKKKNSPNYVVTLHLKVEPWQSDILKKRMEYEGIIYNHVLGMIKPRLLRLKRKLHKVYLESLEYKKTLNITDKEELEKERKAWYKENSAPIWEKFGSFEHTFCDGKKPLVVLLDFGKEHSMSKFFSYFANHYNLGEFSPTYYGLSSNHLASLGNEMQLAINSCLYRKGKDIKSKQKGDVTHIPNKTDSRKTGIRMNLNGISVRYIHVDNKKGEKSENKWMTLPFDLSRNKGVFTEYERHSLGDFSQPYLNNIKKVDIVREVVRGKDKYKVSFTIEGKPFDKGRGLGDGKVGVDVNAHNIAVASQNHVCVDTFQQDLIKLERKKRILQRKIDRSKRALNPNKYNENGTYKKGNKDEWKHSKREEIASAKLCEAQRKVAAKRKIEQTILANKYLEMGNIFNIEKVDWSNLAKRAKETKINKKTGRYKSKKRLGKSIGSNAPGQMALLLKQKVLARGGKVIDIAPSSACTQYDFTCDDKRKHSTKKRSITLSNGMTHQRDLISAFNIAHCDADGNFDIEQMKKDYPAFCTMEEHEMYLHRSGHKKTDSSIVGSVK